MQREETSRPKISIKMRMKEIRAAAANRAATKMKVIPSYWCGTGAGKTPASSIELNMEAYLEHITGGFIWYYDNLQKLKSPNSTKDYADAIENAKPSDEEL